MKKAKKKKRVGAGKAEKENSWWAAAVRETPANLLQNEVYKLFLKAAGEEGGEVCVGLRIYRLGNRGLTIVICGGMWMGSSSSPVGLLNIEQPGS